MNVVFLYNESNIIMDNIYHDIALEIDEYNKKSKNNNFVLTNNIDLKTNYSIYVILSNDIIEIKKLSKSIKDKSKILILTDDLSSNHILECIKISRKISYLRNNKKSIFKKIYSICIIEASNAI